MARFFPKTRARLGPKGKSLSELAIDLEERPSFSRVRFTNNKSLSALCAEQEGGDGSSGSSRNGTPRTPGAPPPWGSCKTTKDAPADGPGPRLCKTPRAELAACKTPRTPGGSWTGGERTPRTPGGRFLRRADRTKIHIRKGGENTTVTLETDAGVKCGATPATAAPEANPEVLKPSLSRAEALGARPGHFDRTHANKVAAGETFTIVLDNDGGDASPASAKSVRVRRALKPTPAAKSERECELEARLAKLEAQLKGQQQAPADAEAAAERDLEHFARSSAPALVALVS